VLALEALLAVDHAEAIVVDPDLSDPVSHRALNHEDVNRLARKFIP
jgi:hypothetical protein